MTLTKSTGPAVTLDATRIEEFADILDVGVIVVDKTLVIRGWNRWLHTATGRHAGETVGQPLRSVIPDLSGFAESALRNACNGAASVMSHRLHKHFIKVPPPAGYEAFSHMQQTARVIPHLGPNGAVVGAVALIEDVTERVAGEEELRAALLKAEGANKAKADFLAAMSHELRTPIGAISGYADLLQQGLFGEVDERQQDPLTRIKSVANHLLGIVQEILIFSRVEAGREDLRLTDTDAQTLLQSAVNAVEPLVVQKGLTLEATTAGEHVPLHTDAIKAGQILINLLGNAIKFTDKGGITVSYRCVNDGKAVQFSVRDSGEGIAASQLERIFEPFTQIDGSLSRRREGTGLGLSVSRQLARLLHGDISVTSEPGVGSTFVVTLPTASGAQPG